MCLFPLPFNDGRVLNIFVSRGVEVHTARPTGRD